MSSSSLVVCALILLGCSPSHIKGPAHDAGLDAASSQNGAPDLGATTDGGRLGPIALGSAAIYSVFPNLYSQAGTFAAVTQDLQRIHDLGFDVLYLSPVTPVGQASGSHPAYGSPYCVHDYMAINPAFGDAADLKLLVQTAHALGMYVILDEVLNHTAWDNPLITQHPEYYLHSDGNPQNVASIEQAFTYADVAQLDYKTPANGLAAYMTNMLTYQIQTFDIDVFRFDTADAPYGAARMIPLGLWQALRQSLAQVKSGLLLLGEEEDPDLAIDPFALDYGWHLQGLYGMGGLRQVATGSDASLLQQAWSYEHTGWPAAMLHMTLLQDWDLEEDLKLYGGVANTMAAAVFTFTMDGVPLLFNGEEVGNDNSGVNTRAVIHWSSPNAAAFTPFYKSLVALRKSNPALQQGSVTWIANSAASSVASYTRTSANVTFLVAINFSDAAVTGTLAAPTANGWTDVTPAGSPSGTSHPVPPTLSLLAHDFAVFRAH
jgi:cyclomaltodextrinase / maltogenic alpha-amylase / neopullulanase